MSTQHFATHDDIYEVVNAFGLMLGLVMMQLEQSKISPAGGYSKILGETTQEWLNGKGLNEHPQGENRLSLQIIHLVADRLTPQEEGGSNKWKPIVIDGGKPDNEES